jgi:AcrR family transcriptional regulator
MKTNKDGVIEAAKSLFEKLGYKKVTMIDIAEAAEISRPTLYTLFKDKDAVFNACIYSHIHNFKAEASEKIKSSKSDEAKLTALFEIYLIRPFSWYYRSKEAFDMLVNASTYAPKSMAVYWKDFEDLLSEVLGARRRDVAKVLVSFSRDVHAHSKNVKELEKLVAVAIKMAV